MNVVVYGASQRRDWDRKWHNDGIVGDQVRQEGKEQITEDAVDHDTQVQILIAKTIHWKI